MRMRELYVQDSSFRIQEDVKLKIHVLQKKKTGS